MSVTPAKLQHVAEELRVLPVLQAESKFPGNIGFSDITLLW